MLIGLHGLARSGKDTVASMICERYDLQRIALADPVRDALLALNPYVAEFPGGSAIPLAEMVRTLGWEGAKKRPEVRRLLQVMGTEVGRTMFGDDAWIALAEDKAEEAERQGRGSIVTDVRFENEAGWVRRRGGVVVHVHRPAAGLTAHGDHASESGVEIDVADFVIDNSGSLDDLAEEVQAMCAALPELAAARKTEAYR